MAARLLPPADVLAVIRGAFVQPPIAPRRIAAETSDDGGRRTLLVMPALRAGGIATVKVVTVDRGASAGLSSHLLVLDEAGALKALIEAHQLTARRTAATSVLAATALGAGDARRLAVLGAGRQARAQIEAFADAMPIDLVTLWARRRSAAEALAACLGDLDLDVRIASTPDEAVRDARIVSSATASGTPLIRGAALASGTHVDLVGGFRPDMREADDAVLRRAAIVVVDTAVALGEAGDLVQPFNDGVIAPDTVALLGDMLERQVPHSDGDITLFKSVGHAAQDLVIAELLLQRLGATA